MKNTIKYMRVVVLLGVSVMMLATACQKEDNNPPVISNFEVGLSNSHIAYVGADLHLEADIMAQHNIQTVEVRIHVEDASLVPSGIIPWEVDSVYTQFSGLKNTLFHEHVGIPSEVYVGAYHLHFVVTDMDGNQTDMEAELQLEVPNDTESPVVEVTQYPENTQVFHSGDVISISALLTDNIALGGTYVALVRVDQQLVDSLITADNTITVLHFHEFMDPDEYQLTASITVGADFDNNFPPKEISGDLAWQSGEYYLVIKAVDAFGGHTTYSSQYSFHIEL
jgi:hypothetical protein